MRVEAIQQVFFGGTLYGPEEKLHEFEIPDKPTRKLTDKEKNDEAMKAIAANGEVPVAFNSKSMRPVKEEKTEKAEKAEAPEETGGKKSEKKPTGNREVI